MKKISTSALAKNLSTSWKELFNLLEKNNLIKRNNDHWELTSKWEDTWAEIKETEKYWKYIVWPEDYNPLKSLNSENIELISISNLAEKFSKSARKMNLIISELWWIEPNLKWWKLTKFWEKIWGKEFVIQKTWATYTKWPINITENTSLLKSIWIDIEIVKDEEESISYDLNFREKFPANHRTKDWHKVRSRWEMLIDDYLYWYYISHAYERKLPIEEDVYSDFYIPAQNWWKAVYIEYWWIEDQEKYQERKKIKQDIYKKYHLNLIEIENKHIDNLDDHLPRMLLKYWISVD